MPLQIALLFNNFISNIAYIACLICFIKIPSTICYCCTVFPRRVFAKFLQTLRLTVKRRVQSLQCITSFVWFC